MPTVFRTHGQMTITLTSKSGYTSGGGKAAPPPHRYEQCISVTSGFPHADLVRQVADSCLTRFHHCPCAVGLRFRTRPRRHGNISLWKIFSHIRGLLVISIRERLSTILPLSLLVCLMLAS